MLDREELKQITSMEGKDGFVVSLYLNVDPMFNKRGDYVVHLKNMLKETAETLDKSDHKKVKDDLQGIEKYVLSNKRLFKKGLVIFSSKPHSIWKEYHLGVPVRNELIVNKSPYTKHLLDVLDNYEKYGVLLVDKESARIFVVHLGEIVEYGEVHTADIPGKHKKGGWFGLSQNHYERHIDFHVGLHLKDVSEKLDSFMSAESIKRLIIGGSDEAVSRVKGMLHKMTLDKVMGNVRVEMFAKTDEVLSRLEPIVSALEKKQKDEMVETLIAKALKGEGAVLGLDNVIAALQEQRVMRLVLLRDYAAGGYSCASCGVPTSQKMDDCPYCKGEMKATDYIVDLAGEKAIQQGAAVEVVEENKRLQESGGIGAFLRF